MDRQREATKQALIEEVVAHLDDRLPEEQVPLVAAFTRRYYGGVPPEDLAGRSVLDLAGASLSLWAYAQELPEGEARVRVYSPRFEDHGWRSVHSVVEIVTDDMPFLVDSVTMELNRHGHTIHLVVHPVVMVRCDGGQRVVDVLPDAQASEPGVRALSCLHVEIDRQTDLAVLHDVEADLVRVLGDVRAVNEDWSAMRGRVEEIVKAYADEPPPVPAAELTEALAFLDHLTENNFTFLGLRAYDLLPDDTLRPVAGTGLGLLRDAGPAGAAARPSVVRLAPEVAALAREPHVLYLTKANSRSTVHRPSYLDYVGVKRFDADGAGTVVGEWRILGLYTSTVYNSPVHAIPLIGQRVAAVIERADFPPRSHDEKSLLDILETYPRDELFQISEDELYDTAMGILALQERQRVRLFIRRDPFGRYLSCLVYVPRDRYNTDVRHRVGAILTSAFPGGQIVDYSARISESVLARLHFVVRADVHDLPAIDVAEIEARLVRASRSWRDDLHAALLESRGEEEGNALFSLYADAFPAAYREAFPAQSAVYDIEHVESIEETGEGLAMSLYRPLEAPAGFLRFKLFWPETAPLLSEVLPVLENMGLRVTDERPFELRPTVGPPVWIHDFGLLPESDGELEAASLKEVFTDAFLHIWRGDAEDDDFNRLVLSARLSWRETSVLRAYAKYLRQAGVTFSQAYMEQTMAANPEVARLLLRLFRAQADPAVPTREATTADLRQQVQDALDAVESLDEDRILRAFLEVITATVRTNFFRWDAQGSPKPYLALKLDPSRISVLPQPRPAHEVFVHSPRVEAVHLRGAAVARGGIRWSDRLEDFRTEVLGLMKAQMVKNAVIVPQGAKGGFVVKRPPAGRDRDALQAEVVACYSTFMRGLLDLTDNYLGGEVVPPPDVVCADGPDPYLVVAADKGTATFSDLANSISHEYGHWLGDAFASGGSVGYDHKEMGITARGAWESVKRHFREMGVDTQTEEFTVVGIGDMSGDVFGNGMLLSRHLKLVAAFNHLDVFLDPDPDPATSYDERARLFALPRSSWADYDPSKISAGGGVFSRSLKSIPLTPEVRRVLGVDADRLPPAELIRAILRAPVDLLWNGGIGTYVKATTESALDVGDRTNDPLRVDAPELRARVVAEGGNLGLTQLGRIEYALAGGRINTDFIDNSAGVDTSDHEVNLKILLDEVVAAGDLTVKQRNALLAEMTEDVAALVLTDNRLQAQALSLAEAQARPMLDRHAALMRALERAGALDRRLEFLPDAKTVAARQVAGRGLTRPELAVLLAYGKNTRYAEVLDSDLPEDAYLSRELADYFPPLLRERFPEWIQRHRLRRELIATGIANEVVNRAGIGFLSGLQTETGAGTADVVRAYTVTREVFDLPSLWGAVERLDAGPATVAHVQTAMLIEAQRLLERGALWLLRSRRPPLDIAAEVGAFAPGIAALSAGLPDLLVGGDAAELVRRRDRLLAQSVPADLAGRVAALEPLAAAYDLCSVASRAEREVIEVASVYFSLGDRLELDWLRSSVDDLPTDTSWAALAKASLRDDLVDQHRALTRAVLRTGRREAGPEELVAGWLEANAARVARCGATIDALQDSGRPDLAMLTVGLRELRTLASTGS